MKEIQSLENNKIKMAHRISARKIPDLWILEGKKLVQEGLQSGAQIEDVFITRTILETEKNLFFELDKNGIPIWLISQKLIKKISGVETPPGIIAIVRSGRQPEWKTPKKFAAILFSIRDPGNFGSILRVAEATGCEHLIYTSDCVDPYSPKVVRASAGSILRVPLVEVRDPEQFFKEKRSEQLSLYALDSHSDKSLFIEKPQWPALLLIGSESQGLPANIPDATRLKIPMLGKVESLNVALAAGICFYWFAAKSA